MKNAFEHLLAQAGHKRPLGTWIMAASPLVAEAVGHAGFDWGVVDMEHTPLDMMEVVHMLQAIAGTRMMPIVRVPWNDSVTVKRVLDAGAQTLLFPFVQDGDDAQRAVQACKYPPQGVRGMAAMSRGSRFGTIKDYFQVANRSISVLAQIETPQAVARIGEIAAVPGIDSVFVGPGDLSGALGCPGQTTHPDVMKLMAEAVRRAREVGKPIGTVGGTADLVVQYRAMGYDYVAVASDLGMLMRGAQAAVKELTTPEGEVHVHTLSGGTQTGSTL